MYGLIKKNENYIENMVEGNISQYFELKYIDETKNYFVEEIEENGFLVNNLKRFLRL